MAESSSIKAQISVTQSISLAPHVLMQDMVGESALLNLQTEAYYSQNQIGTRMFTALTESDSIATAYSTLLEEYEVDPNRLQQELLDFVEQLLKAGLVELCVSS